jgi:hypothetical protein
MTTTQITWPTRIGLSLRDYVQTWADETAELEFYEEEITKITSDLVDFVNRVLSWRLSGQVWITSSGPILAEDSDVPAEQIIRIVVEAVEGFDLFGLVDPDA